MSHRTRTITYHRLSPIARSTIQDHGVSVAAYVRHFDPDGQWHGDRCGCPDDRCAGFHGHDEYGEDCGCLEALLRDFPRGRPRP